ncbi:MAG: aminotransferase class V-fold PLP-dependent enzyme [Candidatus Aminicenantes bacterium]|jgi:selenocysteine lyase/cysteine desulfurase
MEKYDLESIRKNIIGNDLLFDTPFGKRHLLYVDYTASGRGLKFIEEKIHNIQKSYANTHTEDAYAGQYMTSLLHQAEVRIKKLVNAGKRGKIIATGSGTTGALKKLQEILGIYIPAATKERIFKSISEAGEFCRGALEKIETDKPVVFIGPYEHHTNELMWREALVEVVKIGLDQKGLIDLRDLENKLSDSAYKNRMKMGSFSAGSNITGIQTDVDSIARLCHKYDALVFFDYAAVAPYVEINMNKDAESYFDAIFFSPHKFLGGPGSGGILVFNERIYRTDLPPTTAGGGTVSYVGYDVHDFSKDIETREKAGTPPILQTIRASLVLELKERIGIKTIEDIEARYTDFFIKELNKIDNLEILGRATTKKRIPIVSFNIHHNGKILHPKFVTKLMNDLFGIQSRGGCSCAGPYGHILLGIKKEQAAKIRNLILKGYEGIKPGWVRINLHYTLTEDDIGYLLKAVRFIARSGHLFLKRYTFNFQTGAWTYIGYQEEEPSFSVENDFSPRTIDLSRLQEIRGLYLKEAQESAAGLEKESVDVSTHCAEEVEEVRFFDYFHEAV